MNRSFAEVDLEPLGAPWGALGRLGAPWGALGRLGALWVLGPQPAVRGARRGPRQRLGAAGRGPHAAALLWGLRKRPLGGGSLRFA